MPSLPVKRSMKHLRDQGWTVCVVERWKPVFDKKTGQLRPYGVRVDAFGIGDLLACRQTESRPDGATLVFPVGQIALVQATDATSYSKHRFKILTSPDLEAWHAAGGLVLLHGWAKKPKDGIRGARKVWTLKEEVL